MVGDVMSERSSEYQILMLLSSEECGRFLRCGENKEGKGRGREGGRERGQSDDAPRLLQEVTQSALLAAGDSVFTLTCNPVCDKCVCMCDCEWVSE